MRVCVCLSLTQVSEPLHATTVTGACFKFNLLPSLAPLITSHTTVYLSKATPFTLTHFLINSSRLTLNCSEPFACRAQREYQLLSCLS